MRQVANTSHEGVNEIVHSELKRFQTIRICKISKLSTAKQAVETSTDRSRKKSKTIESILNEIIQIHISVLQMSSLSGFNQHCYLALF